MKIKKNTFSTLVLELFFPSIANCKKLKIQKIQKSTSPTGQAPLSTQPVPKLCSVPVPVFIRYFDFEISTKLLNNYKFSK
jgi:hypothetical protein